MTFTVSLLVLSASLLNDAVAFSSSSFLASAARPCTHHLATVASTDTTSLADRVLAKMDTLRDESNSFAEAFDLSPAEAAFYSMFAAIRQLPVPLGLKGEPFVLRHQQIVDSLQQDTNWPGFFSMKDLEKALEDDFLDAARGSTDNRKGWQITDVSQPRGDSFEEARMTFADVQAALEKGTVIFNAAGAHIPKLAGPSLALADATALPGALNLYVTDAGKRTSAPPHTDKQDVVVVQTSGRKHWRVYSPPDTTLKPSADMFSRGKVDDSMPLYQLESDIGCNLLIETTLNPGDVMFVPAAFPHTTSTVVDDDVATDDTSIHLTLGIDHHIWELDYLNARRLALRRACVKDTALGKMRDEENPYTGKANELPGSLRKDLFAELPLGLLEDDGSTSAVEATDAAVSELERIARAVDEVTANAAGPGIWRETIERLREQGVELFNTHRDMYLAALQEGSTREAEEAMTAHLNKSVRQTMTPERMQRLSLFRVKRYYDEIDESKKALKDWSFDGKPADGADGATTTVLPENWAFTLPVTVGMQIEADLGGAFFPATVTRAAGGTYDVQFFDGDREEGLDRSMIKLLAPPAVPSEDADLSSMTPKQLKRWKKQQEKLKKKGL